MVFHRFIGRPRFIIFVGRLIIIYYFKYANSIPKLSFDIKYYEHIECFILGPIIIP